MTTRDKYTLDDLLNAGITKQPVEFEKAFSYLMADRAADAIADKRLDMSMNMFSGNRETVEVEDKEEDHGEEA